MKILRDLLHWSFAAIIAAVIAWTFLAVHVKESDVNCMENRCHIDLDKRIAALEAAMLARTQDRYTGTDAKRDLLIINQRIDAVQAEMREAHR
jgi:parvulin-like peptidyl-prolyl isomerase